MHSQYTCLPHNVQFAEKDRQTRFRPQVGLSQIVALQSAMRTSPMPRRRLSPKVYSCSCKNALAWCIVQKCISGQTCKFGPMRAGLNLPKLGQTKSQSSTFPFLSSYLALLDAKQPQRAYPRKTRSLRHDAAYHATQQRFGLPRIG